MAGNEPFFGPLEISVSIFIAVVVIGFFVILVKAVLK